MKTRKYTAPLTIRILHPIVLIPDELYEPDCRPSEVDSEGNTSLMIASQEGDLHAAKTSILTDAIDVKDEDGWTALMYASYHNHPEVVNFLVQSRANLHLKNNNGKSARFLSYFEGHDEVTRILDTFLTKV